MLKTWDESSYINKKIGHEKSILYLKNTWKIFPKFLAIFTTLNLQRWHFITSNSHAILVQSLSNNEICNDIFKYIPQVWKIIAWVDHKLVIKLGTCIGRIKTLGKNSKRLRISKVTRPWLSTWRILLASNCSSTCSIKCFL
jgi:hypothetical protein